MKKILYLLVFLIITAGLGVGWGVYWLVVLHPGTEIEPANIQRILGRETPVFFNDGTTRLGVFFDQSHRQYVVYEQIPKNFVNALVASEDNSFFSHYGFDPLGILRAAIKNYQVGKVVQGGSTLTQQTAKNLFKRRGRSYQAKIKELIFALRLEYYYSKEKIFEFYANQFFVSGNGHGLGVAARYYFNKSVEELSLLECAFIAGSVKKPNFYNPFIKKSEAATKEARDNGKIRVRYVLEKMLAAGTITAAQFQEAVSGELVFQHGTIGFSQDIVMDLVTDAVATPEVTEALKEQGVENLATSGLHVITTVEQGLQKHALFALRQELSRLDVRLRGYNRGEVQKELAGLDYPGDLVVRPQAFLFGVIRKIGKQAEKGQTQVKIEVDLGEKSGQGTIEQQGMMGLLSSLVKWKQGRYNDASIKDLPLLSSQLQEGDRVWVSVKEIAADGAVSLELERFPQVQGGALILREGRIKAMAGGVENRFFNRAVHARRTMGSAFKPFVYTAALQLGWNATDLLNNNRNMFSYQGQQYFPRPDHKIESSRVSMSWAGVHSENLASVWLLYHLCDHLNIQQFKEVAAHVGLAPIVDSAGHTESSAAYAARIRDRYGILINRTALEAAAFYQAIAKMETDFIFENRIQEYDALKNLSYGTAVPTGTRSDSQNSGEGMTDEERQEMKVQRSLLAGQNYLGLVDLQQELLSYRRQLEDPWSTLEGTDGSDDQGTARMYYDLIRDRYAFSRRELADSFQVVDGNQLRERLSLMGDSEREKFWNEVFLESLFTSVTMKMIRLQTDVELKRLSALPPYNLEVLAAVKDFRILVGLRYLISFARELGVKSGLEAVLSFPLGSNVVSLLEFVRMYEGLVTGEVALAEGQGEDVSDSLAIIDRIESEDGEILYEPRRKKNRMLAPETSIVISHILENIVKFGTGKAADKGVRLTAIDDEAAKKFAGFDLAIPLMGKTGTANNYTNASFFGYLPGVSEQGELVNKGGYAVGVYVGFDDNDEMRHSSTRITGSEGALPTWIELVRELLKEKGYGQRLDPVEISFSGLTIQREPLGQLNLAVQAQSGGVLPVRVSEVDVKNRSTPSVMSFGELDEHGRFIPARHFKPFWRVQEGGQSPLVEEGSSH